MRTRIIGPCARTLELPLVVKSGSFLFFICLKEQVFFFGVFVNPFSEGEFLDYLAHGPVVIIYGSAEWSPHPVEGTLCWVGFACACRSKYCRRSGTPILSSIRVLKNMK